MKKKSTIANIFYNSFGTIFYYGCQWLTTILIVRLSGFTDAGNYSLAMTFTAAFAIFALFNTRQFQVSDVTGEYTDATYIGSRLIAMAGAFVICVLGLFFNQYTMYQWCIILVYMLFKCGEAWIDVYHGIEQKNGRMDYICYSYLFRGVLMLVTFCGALILFHNLLYAIIAMTAATYIIALGYDRRKAFLFIKEKLVWDGSEIKKLMITLIPLVIVSVTNNLSISLPKYFLERYYGEAVLGYYSSVATPSMIVQVGASTIFVPLITPLADKLAADDKKGFVDILKKVAIVFVLLSVLAVVISAWLGEWFLVLIFKEEIRPYAYLFVPIILTTLLISINASLFPVCTVLRELKGQLLVGLGGVLSAVVVSVVCIKRYSMDGVVMALFATLILQIIIEIICVYRKMKAWKE